MRSSFLSTAPPVFLDRDGTLIVVSTQSGIGRGMFTESDARRVNARVAAMLHEQGVEITAWYFCPHAPEASCACRKPLPGMAIGGTGILMTTGYGREYVGWARNRFCPVFDDLEAAAEEIERLVARL